MPTKTLFIIDGSSFLFRAYYGLKPLHTKKNEAVHAVYGFISMIQKLIKQQKAQNIIVAWDSKGKTARHTIYKEYKSQRMSAPSDLESQKNRILEFCDLVDIQCCSKQGVEADDIMAVIAKQWASQTDSEAIVVSSDKDMAQILTHPRIKLFDPFKMLYINRKQAEEKFKIPITKLPFYFALLGDSSDNIPGVHGIGPKTAIKIVNTYKDLDDVFNNLEQAQLTPRIKNILKENKDNAYISQQLFTLDPNIVVSCNLHSTNITIQDFKKAAQFFQNLEMKKFFKEFGSDTDIYAHHEQLHEKYTFICVQTKEQLKAVAKEIQDHKACALDTETTDFNPLTSRMVGLSVACKQGQAYYIPVTQPHKTKQASLFDAETITQPCLALDEVQTILGPIFSDQTIKKYMHNAVFDEIVLERAGLPVQGFIFDTLLAASLTIPEWQKKGLKELSLYFFDEPMLSFPQVLKQEKVKNFADVSYPLATQYAAADAHQTLKLYEVLNKKLKELNVEEVFYTLETPIKDILKSMQQKGILCDINQLEEANTQALCKLQAIEEEIYNLSGERINLNSPAQVKHLLFEVLQLPPQKKSAKKTGYSTDAEVLKILSRLHIVPHLILQYRELSKITSTYLQGLPAYINPETGKIHSTFHQSMVATGRLSSSSPNLQNIPTGLGERSIPVRKAFYAPEGYTLISADYSQIELRILAYFSQDPGLIDAFKNNTDIHSQTAAKLFDTAIEKVTPEQRSIGKKINFSILYGLTPYGLSKDLQIPFNQAKEYIETYFKQYPNIQNWMHTVVEETKEHGYTKTLLGRKRFVPGIYEKNTNLFNLAKRIAINTPVQGTAAEIMKLGMLAYTKACKEKQLNADILLQIHDEIIVQAPTEKVKEVEALLKEALEKVVNWNIALQINTKIGRNWQDITK